VGDEGRVWDAGLGAWNEAAASETTRELVVGAAANLPVIHRHRAKAIDLVPEGAPLRPTPRGDPRRDLGDRGEGPLGEIFWGYLALRMAPRPSGRRGPWTPPWARGAENKPHRQARPPIASAPARRTPVRNPADRRCGMEHSALRTGGIVTGPAACVLL
jgi:hypothetical protein